MCASTKMPNWQSILENAAHCEDCSDPVCLRACPQGIDIPTALKYLLTIKPGIWWVEDMHSAIEYADGAIAESFG